MKYVQGNTVPNVFQRIFDGHNGSRTSSTLEPKGQRGNYVVFDFYPRAITQYQSIMGCVSRTLSSFSRFPIGAINSSSVEGIGDEESKPDQFRDKFGDVPFIALFFAGYLIAGVGWWNLHFRDGVAVWVCCIIVGIVLALWGGWNWLIVAHNKPVPQVSNRAVTLLPNKYPVLRIISPNGGLETNV
jgi:hypothetical protein